MDIRYATHPNEIYSMNTADLRNRFLVENLFIPNTIQATYSHHDRVVIAGVSPAEAPLTLGSFDALRTEYFFDNREAGIVNVGASGEVRVDGTSYTIPHGGCLYIGRGAQEVEFSSSDDAGARFYVFSAPAHATFPTVSAAPGEGNVRVLGDQLTSNSRTIHQFIHEGGIQSCQVVMGVTVLDPGSMWNTMPAHTHDRRTECYLYFDVPDDQRVIHLMGEPQESRHIIMANEQAVISPSWSLHSGVGTSAYSFIWAMAGENKAFDDMDHVTITEIR